MAKVTISKLLKAKNRVASEITRTKAKIKQHNSYLVDKDIPVNEVDIQVDVRSLNNDLAMLINKLVTIKSLINKANVNVADKIYRLAEVKGMIVFYEGMDCDEGRVDNYYTRDTNNVKRCQIKLSEKENLVKKLILQCEELQDELDEFNASHRIEVPEDLL